MGKKLRVLIPKSDKLSDQERIIRGLMSSLGHIEGELNMHFKREKENDLPALKKKTQTEIWI